MDYVAWSSRTDNRDRLQEVSQNSEINIKLQYWVFTVKVKGKAIPVTDNGGPQICEAPTFFRK
jgi:hypothetical protein